MPSVTAASWGHPRAFVILAADKRNAPRRYPYGAHVRIDGRAVRGRDISQSGISVYTVEPLPLDATVVVTLGWVPGGTPQLSARARVVRVAPEGEGYIIGLEFLQGDEP